MVCLITDITYSGQVRSWNERLFTPRIHSPANKVDELQPVAVAHLDFAPCLPTGDIAVELDRNPVRLELQLVHNLRQGCPRSKFGKIFRLTIENDIQPHKQSLADGV